MQSAAASERGEPGTKLEDSHLRAFARFLCCLLCQAGEVPGAAVCESPQDRDRRNSGARNWRRWGATRQNRELLGPYDDDDDDDDDIHDDDNDDNDDSDDNDDNDDDLLAYVVTACPSSRAGCM